MASQSLLRPNLALTISAPLLYLIIAGPTTIQAHISEHLPKSLNKARLTTFLTWLLALGAGAQINSWLNAWARANWLLWNRGRGEQLGANGWDKEIVVLTGGSNGIGYLTAKGLAFKGLKVCILDIVEPSEQIENIHFFKCDVTVPEEVKQAADAIRDRLGSPTILINNAGIAHAHTILNSSQSYLRKLFDVNVISYFYTLQAFLPDMIKKKKGHIVTLASMASYVGPPGLVDYTATKAAVLALHEGLISELKHRYDAPEVKTTVVQPIYVRTNLITTWKQSLKQNKKAVVLRPETVANAIVAQILSNRSGQIRLPGSMGVVASWIRAMPWWIQEVIRDGLKKDVLEEVPASA